MNRRYSVLGVFLLALLLAPGCNKDDDKGLLVFHTILSADVKTWDPANAYDVPSLTAIGNVYETLYQFSYFSKNYRIEPLLAADLPTLSKDGRTVTIHLQRGVHFAKDPCFGPKLEQRELHAQDFVFAFKRLALPGMQSHGWRDLGEHLEGMSAFHEKLAQAARSELINVFTQPVEGVTATDDYTLRLKLTSRYPQLLNVLSMSFTAPIALRAAERYSDEDGRLADHPVGTGPFLLSKWKRGREIVLDRNPDFHAEFYPTTGDPDFDFRGMLADSGRKLPFLDRIRMRISFDPNLGWASFLRSELDWIPVPSIDFDQAITDQSNLVPDLSEKGIRLRIQPSAKVFYLFFNMNDPLLGKNKFLRQAISSAIDRDRWIQISTNGTGKKAATLLPPGILERPNLLRPKYDFNLARAKYLLKRAGYPEGNGLPPIKLELRGSDLSSRELGAFLARSLREIGVTLTTVYGYTDQPHQIAFSGWSMDFPDPENAYQLLYGPNQSPGPNEANFNDAKLNRLFEKFATLKPGNARAALVRKMDAVFQEQCPWVLGYYPSDYSLTHPWVLNLRTDDIIYNKFKYIRINAEIRNRYLELK